MRENATHPVNAMNLKNMLIKSFHWIFYYYYHYFLIHLYPRPDKPLKESESQGGFGSWNPVFTEILKQCVLSGDPACVSFMGQALIMCW